MQSNVSTVLTFFFLFDSVPFGCVRFLVHYRHLHACDGEEGVGWEMRCNVPLLYSCKHV